MLALSILLFTLLYIKCSLEHKTTEVNEEIKVNSSIKKHKKVYFDTGTKHTHCESHHSVPTILRQSTDTNHFNSSSLTNLEDNHNTKESSLNSNYSCLKHGKSIILGDSTIKPNNWACCGRFEKISMSSQELVCIQPLFSLGKPIDDQDIIEELTFIKEKQTDINIEEIMFEESKKNQNKKCMYNYKSCTRRENYSKNNTFNSRFRNIFCFNDFFSRKSLNFDQDNYCIENENECPNNFLSCDPSCCNMPDCDPSCFNMPDCDPSCCNMPDCDIPDCDI